MPQPLPKYVEINDELTDRLSADSVLSEMEFYRYIKSIESIKDKAMQNYLFAMTYAAYGEKEKAIPFFEQAISDGVIIAPNNYLAYINNVGTFTEVRDLSLRLAQLYVNKQILHTAYQSCLFSGDIEQATLYAVRYINIAEGKESQEMAKTLAEAKKEVSKFKEIVGLSDDDFKKIAGNAIHVLEHHGAKISGLAYQSIQEEHSSSYVVMVKGNDPEKIAEMNIDLAFALADCEQLTDKRFSAWFRGQEGEGNVRNS
ncbi:MAG: hypothetical protein E6Y18_06175 [Serratia marcescens]|uniref:hypothetical protein n=1 Tax=Serratia TaxID=613 RepID=UPI000BD762D7|nr:MULTISPECIES: hypothetical protein [Serratia]MDI3229240.1 hypothetical protein [Serratia marcescens]MDU4688589.1 hypothetical protein [Serratia marcescens]WAZ00833.1 hypothetical protein O3T14_18015 [Serratia marcescens]SOD33738.1 hypothetical protein SAMN06272783_2738 [Serratia sp. JKS296]